MLQSHILYAYVRKKKNTLVPSECFLIRLTDSTPVQTRIDEHMRHTTKYASLKIMVYNSLEETIKYLKHKPLHTFYSLMNYNCKTET